MAEQFKSITEARKDLPSLSQTVQDGVDRFVITNQGKPQAVLMGFEEYKGLLAASELLNRPRDLADLEEGLQQTKKLSFEELKANLGRRKAALTEGEIPVTVAKVTQPAPAASIVEKLDEIQGNLNQILDRLWAGEPVALMDEVARRIAKSGRRRVSGYPASHEKGQPIKVEVTKIRDTGRIRALTLAEAAATAEAKRKTER